MNKTDLIERVAARTGMTKRASADAVNIVFEEIENALATGSERVSISGFGSFTAMIIPARKMKTPLNAAGFINAKRTAKIRFHASDKLRTKVTKKNKAPVYKKK